MRESTRRAADDLTGKLVTPPADVQFTFPRLGSSGHDYSQSLSRIPADGARSPSGSSWENSLKRREGQFRNVRSWVPHATNELDTGPARRRWPRAGGLGGVRPYQGAKTVEVHLECVFWLPGVERAAETNLGLHRTRVRTTVGEPAGGELPWVVIRGATRFSARREARMRVSHPSVCGRTRRAAFGHRALDYERRALARELGCKRLGRKYSRYRWRGIITLPESSDWQFRAHANDEPPIYRQSSVSYESSRAGGTKESTTALPMSAGVPKRPHWRPSLSWLVLEPSG